MRSIVRLFTFFIAFSIASSSMATVWTTVADGSWGTPANWDQGTVPGGINDSVVINHTIAMDASRTVASLVVGVTGIVNEGTVTKPTLVVARGVDIDGRLNDVVFLPCYIGANFVMDGTGIIADCQTRFRWNTDIAAGADLHFVRDTIILGVAVIVPTVSNYGSVTQLGTNCAIRSLDAGGTWVNAGGTSVLAIGGTLFDDGNGILDVTTVGNTVNYNGTVSQNIFDTAYYNLTIDSLDVKSLVNTLDVNGNLTITESAQLDVNGFDITVAGNWSNDSDVGDPFLQGAQSVTFDGTAAQSITCALGETFHDLTINNTSATGITLSGNTSVANVLQLTDGNIYTTAADLLIINDDATSTSGSVNSFVDGPMRKIGDDAFVFPTGDGSIWARIAISAPGATTDAFDAEYFDTDFGVHIRVPALADISIIEYWDLDRSAGTSDVDVTLYWEDGTRSGVTNLGDLRVGHYSSGTSQWEDEGNGGTSGAAAAGTVTSAAAVTSFSPFTLGSFSVANPLPVELLSFEVEERGDAAVLSWSTASEINNAYFAIERSETGRHFEKIGVVNGNGNSTAIHNYQFIDESPLIGTSYYRLRQVDFDGRFEYAHVTATFFRLGLGDINIYPQPVNDFGAMTIDLSGLEFAPGTIEATIHGSDGRVVFSGKVSARGKLLGYSGALNQEHGIYILTLTHRGEPLHQQRIAKSLY